MRTKKRFVTPFLIPVGIGLIIYAVFLLVTMVNFSMMDKDSIRNLIFLSIMILFGIFFIFAMGVIELKLADSKITKYINLVGLKIFRVHTNLPKNCKGILITRRKAFWHRFLQKENYFFNSSYDVAVLSMRDRAFNVLNVPKEDALKYGQALADHYKVELSIND